MARPLRLEYPGAVYHVTSRGNERSPIFRDDRDRRRFLEILCSLVESERWLVHAYCLMSNHYHLLVETPRANLVAGMRRLNARYSQWFNVRHRRTGHLLRGRYKAILVEKQAYLLELCRYVVLNPIRARMVRWAGKWPWSNYRATAGMDRAPGWLEVDWTLSQFGRSRWRARQVYREFVAEGKGAASPWQQLHGQIYLGGETFLKEMDLRLKGRRPDDSIPSQQKKPRFAELSQICAVVAKEFDQDPAALGRRRGGEDKMAAIYLARKHTGLPGKQVAEAFGVKPARVSNIVTEIEGGKRKSLVKRLRGLEGKLRLGL